MSERQELGRRSREFRREERNNIRAAEARLHVAVVLGAEAAREQRHHLVGEHGVAVHVLPVYTSRHPWSTNEPARQPSSCSQRHIPQSALPVMQHPPATRRLYQHLPLAPRRSSALRAHSPLAPTPLAPTPLLTTRTHRCARRHSCSPTVQRDRVKRYPSAD